MTMNLLVPVPNVGQPPNREKKLVLPHQDIISYKNLQSTTDDVVNTNF